MIDIILQIEEFDDCKCGDPFECNRVDGIVVESTTCTDVQQVRAIGYGTYTGQFQWDLHLSSAEAVDFPGDPNPITDGPTLKVRQVNPSVNPTIGVRLLTCPDPDAVDNYKYTTQLNLIAASLDPGTLLVTGPAEAQMEQTEHFYLNGTAAGKPNNVFAMSVDQPGYVVNTWSPMTRLAVRWDVIPSGGLGTVRGNATACGGHIVHARRDVPVEDNL